MKNKVRKKGRRKLKKTWDDQKIKTLPCDREEDIGQRQKKGEDFCQRILNPTQNPKL